MDVALLLDGVELQVLIAELDVSRDMELHALVLLQHLLVHHQNLHLVHLLPLHLQLLHHQVLLVQILAVCVARITVMQSVPGQDSVAHLLDSVELL